MTCKEFLDSLNYDAMDPTDVIRVISESINSSLETPEQKLFVIGKIIDLNKEQYITELKKKISKHHNKEQLLEKNISQLKKEIEKLTPNPKLVITPKKLPNFEESKKKVIVVKKKVN